MLVPGAYLPGLPPPKVEPLSRVLPPVSSGVISSWLAAQIPIGRGGTAEEVAEAALWLLSDKASYVAATLFNVSGGR